MFKKRTQENEVLQKANEVLEIATKLLNKLEIYDARLNRLTERIDKLEEEKFMENEIPYVKKQPEETKPSKPINLKTIREKNKLSQRAVAEKIGVNQSTYWGYETGNYKPSFTVCAKLAELFGCKVKDIQDALKVTADEAFFKSLIKKEKR